MTTATAIPTERAGGWTVTCSDGQVRHEAPFRDRYSAEQFANWGHLCTAEHTYAQAMPLIEVGDGMTEIMWSDRHAYTVVGVNASGKTLTVQPDRAIRTDDNGMSDDQRYRYEADPDAPTTTVRWTVRKGVGAFRAGGRTFALGRHAYHDYSF